MRLQSQLQWGHTNLGRLRVYGFTVSLPRAFLSVFNDPNQCFFFGLIIKLISKLDCDFVHERGMYEMMHRQNVSLPNLICISLNCV